MHVQADHARVRSIADDANADAWPCLGADDRASLQALLTMFDVAARVLRRHAELCKSTEQLVSEIEKE